MTDYFTPILEGAPLDAEVLNAPLYEINDKLAAVIAGEPLAGLSVGTPTELTIATGVVTRAYVTHLIDTEADAAEDDLTTINGGSEGDILIISIANAARAVVIKHGTGNIDLASNLDIRLSSVYKMIALRYLSGRWSELNGLPTKASTYNSFYVPDGMPLTPSMAMRNRLSVRASDAAFVGIGVTSPTKTANTGTLVATNQTDSTYLSVPSGAVSTNSGGFAMPSYNLFRPSHNPILTMLIRTGLAADIANIRLWFGICSAAMTNVSTIAGATEAAVFRYDTVAGDTGFVPVTKDSTTQNTGGAMVTIAASSRYLLQIEMDYLNGRVGFRINNGATTWMTANLPASATEMGVNMLAFTQAASSKTWYFSRFEALYD